MSATNAPDAEQNDSEMPPESLNATPSEVTKLQIIFITYDKPDVMQRSGIPNDDVTACATAAEKLMQRHDVREVFIANVHAAYVKETNIKKVI